MPRREPACRVVSIGLLVSLLLGWLATHTEVLFADGLRYIAQAQTIGQGSAGKAIAEHVDHPAYPLAVAAAHRLTGGRDAGSWQTAAQLASVLAGVLLVVPLYLLVAELFGEATALPACLLFYAVPLTGHVFADALSESTFLLFWTWGLWGSLRFLRVGGLGWLPLIVVMSALAYLTRPEGLLLPVALVTTVGLSPRWVLGKLRGSRVLAVLAGVVAGVGCLVGPYVAMKGGLTAKPSVARLLGTAPKSAAHAVERQRPLEAGQSPAKTWLLAAKAVTKAVSEAVTSPLLPLALLGSLSLRLDPDSARLWRLIAVIVVASLLALVRLHATGGYCSPRHAMILALLAIPAAAFGLCRVVGSAVSAFGPRAGAVGWGVATAALLVAFAPSSIAPVNEGLGGYRQAGRWLASNADGRGRVVDVTGWSQFYGDMPSGYTFENLVAAQGDPSARWVVVREAHLRGPWENCERLRALVGGREPVRAFRGTASRRGSKVFVFDRQAPLALKPPGRPESVRR